MAKRVVSGQPQQSALWVRLAARGSADQMPPLGTDRLNHGIVMDVGRWIIEMGE